MQDKKKISTAVEAGNLSMDDVVEINIPGARITKELIMTPPIGNGKDGPKKRWFIQDELKFFPEIINSVTIHIHRYRLDSRGIKHFDLKIIKPG